MAHEAVKLIVAFDGTKQISRVELVADAFCKILPRNFGHDGEGAESDSVVVRASCRTSFFSPRISRASSLSKSTSSPPYQVDIALRATAAAAKLTLRSGHRSVLHFNATALPTDLCEPESEVSTFAALQRGSLPQCFDDWCESRRHDPAYARTWA